MVATRSFVGTPGFLFPVDPAASADHLFLDSRALQRGGGGGGGEVRIWGW